MVAGDGGARFAAYLATHRPRVESAVAALCDACGVASVAVPGPAADLARYLHTPLAAYTARGGKRVRPVLALLGAEAVGAEASCALTAGAAIELFQTAALIHDDIADSSELRRGEPCLHLTEGVGIAVNVGDAALVAVSAAVLRDESLDCETRLAVLGELVSMEERTLEGQALDLGWARDGRWDISAEDYLCMAERKTAHYSAATPLVCGALCGGGSPAQVEALRTFGLRAGLAFQLQDDLLNLVGDAAAQGKDFRSDIAEGKRTLLAVWALAHLPSAQAAELEALLSSGTADTAEQARAVELMEAAGAMAHTRELAAELAASATDALAAAELDADATATLASMAAFFVERAG